MIMNNKAMRWSIIFLLAVSPLFVAGYLHY